MILYFFVSVFIISDITIFGHELIRDICHPVEVPSDPHPADLDPDADDLVLLLLVRLPHHDGVLVLVLLHLRIVHALAPGDVDGVAHPGRAEELLGAGQVGGKLPVLPVPEDQNLRGLESLVFLPRTSGNNQYLETSLCNKNISPMKIFHSQLDLLCCTFHTRDSSDLWSVLAIPKSSLSSCTW